MLWLLAVACATASDPSAAPPAASPPAEERMTAVTETIEETTVGDLGGVPVPMGNMITDEYTLPDGSKRNGLVCALALQDGAVWVGKGSVVQVGGARWEVVAIEKTRGELGSVTLKKLD